MNLVSKKEACDLIKKSSSPLILIPENFNIDIISGALGLYLFLKKNKKNPKIVCPVIIPEKFLFLEDKKIIEHSVQGKCLYKISFDVGESEINELSYLQEGGILKINFAMLKNGINLEKPRVSLLKFKHDLIFSIGNRDLESLGKIYYDNSCFFSESVVINIDCQLENKKFGRVNLVQPHSSVSEIIAEIVSMTSRDILDSRMADLFLTGIVAKTDNFQLEKIKAETFAIASILLRSGANREEIIKHLLSVNLLAEEKIEFYPSSKIIKQVVDKINRESDWYLCQEKGRTNPLDGLKDLSSNQRIFYLTAMLGVIPGLILLEQVGFNPSSIFRNNEDIFSGESLMAIGEKKDLSYDLILLSKVKSTFSLLDETKQDLLQNENLVEIQDKIAVISLVVAQEDSAPKNKEEVIKNIISENKTQEIGFPKKFSMPLFGINTEIQKVGLASSGGMGVPSNSQSVAWFSLGVKPGENGNAVIAGHLDTYSGSGAVFWNLNKFKAGDYVYVTDEYNKKMRFRVVWSEIYDAENAPMGEIFGPSLKSHLNMVTCDGVWDKEKKNYNKRLVVYTDYDPE